MVGMKEKIQKALKWGKENKIKAKLIVLLVLIGVFFLTVLVSKLTYKQVFFGTPPSLGNQSLK